MDAQERRQAIARRLEEASGPVSAAVLAREHSVSRQIIVGDIALLRAGGMDIAATPRGYVLPAPAAGLVRTLACRHRADQMEEELNAMVDQGCTVLDVIVEHPIKFPAAMTWASSSSAAAARRPPPCPSSPRASTSTPWPAPARRPMTGCGRV